MQEFRHRLNDLNLYVSSSLCKSCKEPGDGETEAQRNKRDLLKVLSKRKSGVSESSAHQGGRCSSLGFPKGEALR